MTQWPFAFTIFLSMLILQPCHLLAANATENQTVKNCLALLKRSHAEFFDVVAKGKNGNHEPDPFHKGLMSLQRKLESKYAASTRVDTVLYDLAGYDVGTMLQIFPKATNYIVMDRVPFMDPREIRTKGTVLKLNVQTPEAEAFAIGLDVLRMESLGAHILNGLQRTVPNFRLVQIQTFNVEGNTWYHRGADRVAPNVYSENGKCVHGWITFDQGDGNLKNLIFIHDEKPIKRYRSDWWTDPGYEPENLWWVRWFDRNPPQAIIVKGTHGVFSGHGLEPGTKQVNFFRNRMLRWLGQSKGLLIEGLAKNPSGGYGGEFSANLTDPSSEANWGFGVEDTPDINEDRVRISGGFGYGDYAGIIDFAGQR